MEGNDYVNLLCVRINSDKERIEKRQWDKIEVDCFNLADFWNQFGSAVQALSNEVTKICFATGQKPFPSRADVDSMLTDLTQFYTVMRDLYLVLPDEVGATVYDAVTSALVKILVALIAIVRSLNDISEQGAKERLSLTGTLWDACNAVESLPRDNLLAVLSVIEDESSLAKDAQDELSTVMEKERVECELTTEKQDNVDNERDEEMAKKRKEDWINEEDNFKPVQRPPPKIAKIAQPKTRALISQQPVHRPLPMVNTIPLISQQGLKPATPSVRTFEIERLGPDAVHFPNFIISAKLCNLVKEKTRLNAHNRTRYRVFRPDGTHFTATTKKIKSLIEEPLVESIRDYFVKSVLNKPQ